MDRRAFLGTLAGGLLGATHVAEVQQADKVWNMGYLSLNMFQEGIVGSPPSFADLAVCPRSSHR
jgi:hypothetical protein